MTTQQDKELSSELIADVAREAFAHALKGGNIWALDTLPKRVELAHALATSPQLPVAEPTQVIAAGAVTDSQIWDAYLLMLQQVPYFGKEAAIANARAMFAAPSQGAKND